MIDYIVKVTADIPHEHLVIALVTLIAILIVLIVTMCSYHYFTLQEKKQGKMKVEQYKGRKFVLNVVRVDRNGIESSHWHGREKGDWIFTYEEAVARKKRISHMFKSVQIIDYSSRRNFD